MKKLPSAMQLKSLVLFILLLGGIVTPPLILFASFHDPTPEGSNPNCSCGNCSDPSCVVCSSGYSQGGYYSQAGYYSQNTYYVQATYYLQGGYWPAIDDVTLTATPLLLRSGESTTVTWDGGNATACTLTGGGLNVNAVSGTQDVPVYGQVVFSVSCNLGPNISMSSTTVKIVPSTVES